MNDKHDEPACCPHRKHPANDDGSCSAFGYNGVDCQSQPCVCREHFPATSPDSVETDLDERRRPIPAPVGDRKSVAVDADQSERLPFSPDEAIERLRQVLRMLEQVTDHKGAMSTQSPLPKARVFLRGIIGCGISGSQESKTALHNRDVTEVGSRLSTESALAAAKEIREEQERIINNFEVLTFAPLIPRHTIAAIISKHLVPSAQPESVGDAMKPCAKCGNLFRYPPSDNKADATLCAYCDVEGVK